MTDDKQLKLSQTLNKAGETHHAVYAIVDGADDDWASWYADWLLELSDLPKILGGKPIRSHLVHTLVQAERDFEASGGKASWQDFYARAILEAGI
jgi:hypothetical protein